MKNIKHPADQTGFYEKPVLPQEDDSSTDILLLVVIICFGALMLFTSCASTPPTVGECINGKVTWSDGTTERCKILKQSGSI